ncbi:MAG: hypothetical protein COA63_001445 [Methylophaga sp.]|nr:hypothetical protein [Methylophaga sp.]
MQITQGKSDLLLHNVFKRYQTLIDLSIYHPMSMTDIKAWVNNFRKPLHRFVAGYILDRLIYRSSDMARSSYRSFLISVMRDIYFDYKDFGHIDSVETWQERLNSADPAIQIDDFFIVPVRLLTDSGASGDTVCRLVDVDSSYTKHITGEGFEQLNIGVDNEIPTNTVILLVDDLLGSGDQVKTLIKEKKLEKWCEKNKVIYAPLMATEKGLKKVTRKFPFLEVHPIEILEKEQRIFSFQQNEEIIIDGESYPESEIISAYNEMLDLFGMLKRNEKGKIQRICYGRDKFALPLAFEWGCPNQTLALLWWGKAEVSRDNAPSLTQLFRRRGMN